MTCLTGWPVGIEVGCPAAGALIALLLAGCSNGDGAPAAPAAPQNAQINAEAAVLEVRPTELVARIQGREAAGIPAKGDEQRSAIITAAGRRCGMTSVADCWRSSELVWHNSFRPALNRFLGRRSARYLYDQPASVSDQATDVLGGPPDDARLVGRFFAFSACRYQSCDEKGAIVLEADGTIRAVAILHYFTPDAVEGEQYSRWNLDIYFTPIAESESINAYLWSWANAEMNLRHGPARPFGRLALIDVVTNADGATPD